MSKKTFRVPQGLVSDKIGTELSIGDVSKMYAGLAKNADDENLGGREGQRWAHRVLRQEGVLKSSNVGDVIVPAFVDLQLGPEFYVGLVNKSVDECAQALVDAGIRGCATQLEDGAAVFFTKDDSNTSDVQGDLSAIFKADDFFFAEESRTRVRMLAKSADEGTACSCYVVDPMKIGNLQFDDTYLLRMIYKAEYQVTKVEESLGLVFGWAIICKINGEDHFDRQNDHIPEDEMLRASTEFMLGDRVNGDMHLEDENGDVVKAGKIAFAWPMTEEIAKAFNLDSTQTGLMIAAKIDDPEVLKKFEDGTYTGFSIGGKAMRQLVEEVE